MKRNLFLLGLAVAAMTSCTNDEVLDIQQPVQKAIGFDSFVNKGTRADEDVVSVTNEVTSSNLARFYVYGYYGTDEEVFDDVSVIKSGDKWVMETRYEKNWETESYHFAAYADGPGDASHEASALTTSFAEGTLNITGYVVNGIQGSQTDLIAAVAERDNTTTLNTTKVDLTFSHLLSKVDFTFENTNENVLSMVVKNVVLKVKNSANCQYNGTASWGSFSNETSYQLAQPSTGNVEGVFGGDKDLAGTENKYIIAQGGSSSVSVEYFVIPGQTDATISFTVSYYDTAGNLVQTYDKELSLFPTVGQVQVAWNPSYIYKYNVQLPASPKKIEFNVAGVGNWKEANVTMDGSYNQ